MRPKSTQILAMLLLVSLAGCYSKRGTDIAGVDNFGVVDSSSSRKLLRGAQPTEEGIQTLRDKGVRTIVNLRDHPDEREERWVRAAGMQYVRIPSKCDEPRLEDLRTFLKIVAGKPCPPLADGAVDAPIFVHCYIGCDRTGLFVAAYRMAHDNWTAERAIAEMDAFGHNYICFPENHPFLRELDPAKLREP
ncbi:MAG: tyrosine-protein phosphatase [Tepidisphaerales bacterium]